ncbi:unnamed protein product [Thlaspi arvense]|uniref:Uncharacterized protein n=1 Tax=Thlaspi arvense TaxID=13288 RepID=A0AAU9SPG3_THLAR|nr:unnamed protein product [Thlaspi arvense]
MEGDLLGICGFDSTKKYRLEQLAKYQSGSCIEFEDVEGDYDMAVDYPCPFCSDDYDLVELCHHIDEEHQLDAANNGVIPIYIYIQIHLLLALVCDVVYPHLGSLTETYLEQKQRLHKDESYSAFSPGTKKYLQSLIDTSKSVPDSLLSFVYNPPLQNQPKLVLPDLSSGANMADKCLIRDSTEKERKSLSPLSDTELIEKAKKREFVQGLISTAMFNNMDDF